MFFGTYHFNVSILINRKYPRRWLVFPDLSRNFDGQGILLAGFNVPVPMKHNSCPGCAMPFEQAK